jgi:acyl-CoA reductase-like NAD-dependent aldehyde dehydrogenase
MKMYINGHWVEKSQTAAVLNPFDQSVIDTVPRADAADVEQAIASAVRGAKAMSELTAYQRYAVLRRAVDLMAERSQDLARTITLEEGKVLAEGRGEVQRAIQTLTLSSEEAKRLHGETGPSPWPTTPASACRQGSSPRTSIGPCASPGKSIRGACTSTPRLNGAPT